MWALVHEDQTTTSVSSANACAWLWGWQLVTFRNDVRNAVRQFVRLYTVIITTRLPHPVNNKLSRSASEI